MYYAAVWHLVSVCACVCVCVCLCMYPIHSFIHYTQIVKNEKMYSFHYFTPSFFLSPHMYKHKQKNKCTMYKLTWVIYNAAFCCYYYYYSVFPFISYLTIWISFYHTFTYIKIFYDSSVRCKILEDCRCTHIRMWRSVCICIVSSEHSECARI